MFGLGPWEIALIVIAILLVFGAEKIPDIFKSLGKAVKEFKKASQNISENVIEDENGKEDNDE